MTKRWGVALKNNVVLEHGETFHNSKARARSYTIFRSFDSRNEARAFRKARTGKTTVMIDRTAGTVVR